MEDLRLSTRVAAAAYAGCLNKPAIAAKCVVSRKTLAQGVVTPTKKTTASASAHIVSSPAANVAVTAKITPTHANNTADSVRRKRITVTAARPASRLQQTVCVVQCALNSYVFAAKTAENQTVESIAQGAKRS